VRAVVRGEEQRPVDVHEPGARVDVELAWERAALPGVDVLDKGRGLGIAAALPELATVDAVAGSEEDCAIDVGESVRLGAARSSRDDVSGQARVLGGAVALSERAALDSGRRAEKQRAVHVGERIRPRGKGSGRDVRDEARAVGRAVALPELAPMHAVVGREEERAVDVGEESWR
jgi:hypothetical protein